MLRKILQFILKYLAKIVLWKYQPEIIGITGSVGKTSAKEAIYRVLKGNFVTRKNYKNYNNEIGAPLTILGIESCGCFIGGWLIKFIKLIPLIIFRKKYPEVLVLELGVDKPNDMKYFLSFLKPKVGVFTAIGEFPVHLEFFPERSRLIGEKARLVKFLPKNGLAVLNYDDLSVREIGHGLNSDIKKIYYGFSDNSDLKIINYEIFIKDLKKRDFGINFKIDYRGSVAPIRLNCVLGKQHAFAAAAAAAVGSYFGLNLVEIATALKKYRSLAGRTNLIEGIKETWIIDDCYNASPISSISAIELLSQIEANGAIKRKIAVLGDMLELGEKTEDGHRRVGQVVVENKINLLFLIGSRVKFIANEAIKKGMIKDNIFEFQDVREAGLALQKKLESGDLVLVKGSRSMHLENIVREIMLNPERADKILASY